LDNLDKYSGFWTAGQLQDLTNASSPFVWKMTTTIGGTREQRIGYTKWQIGEPNNYGSPFGFIEACVFVRASFHTWHDVFCLIVKCYLCELEG